MGGVHFHVSQKWLAGVVWGLACSYHNLVSFSRKTPGLYINWVTLFLESHTRSVFLLWLAWDSWLCLPCPPAGRLACVGCISLPLSQVRGHVSPEASKLLDLIFKKKYKQTVKRQTI